MNRRPSQTIGRCLVLCLFACISPQNGLCDELIYGYEGNVLPTHPSEGWWDGDPCTEECSQYVQGGSFILRWEGGHNVNIGYVIAEAPEEPPESLWLEWQFASNHPYLGISAFCDARFAIRYRDAGEIVRMFGDTAFDWGRMHVLFGLEVDEFHTYRFESLDGTNYCIFVDGGLFFCGSDPPSTRELHQFWFGGEGGCSVDLMPTFNRYDHIRYGTISFGEQIIESDPESGVLESAGYPKLDRFTVTFDTPNYVHIDEITVDVTGGDAPAVLKTGRVRNGDPETVEVVLDRPLTVGETTTFTFDDGEGTNVIEYTVIRTDACCLADGSCVISEPEDCAFQGGEFVQGGTCADQQACCYSDGDCADLPPVCCTVDGGTPGLGDLLCEGDPDGDDLDATCGDACPTDPNKISPEQCGCGLSETDADLDTISDCVDRCPGDDDRIDEDHNDIPDCLQFQAIPTASEWGLTILALTLLVVAKVAFGRRRESRIRAGSRQVGV